jgi:ABC-2 type transport system ATP-binding protein
MSGATKRFGGFTAVSNLSFQVPEGQIIGFLGPNGAGKSTSLRMALGVMQPDEGSVSLFGAVPDIKNLRRVGFLPEERGLYKKMTARDTITYFARLKGMSAPDARARANELLEMTGLGAFRASRISKLSKGMAQKVQILSTLAHRPDFLILDEPFSGLDPMNQQTLEDLIRAEHARGSVFLGIPLRGEQHAPRCSRDVTCPRRGKRACGAPIRQVPHLRGPFARSRTELRPCSGGRVHARPRPDWRIVVADADADAHAHARVPGRSGRGRVYCTWYRRGRHPFGQRDVGQVGQVGHDCVGARVFRRGLLAWVHAHR